jgi:hypothetical protein
LQICTPATDPEKQLSLCFIGYFMTRRDSAANCHEPLM